MKRFKVKTYSVSLSDKGMDVNLWESTNAKGTTVFFRDNADSKMLFISTCYSAQQADSLFSTSFINTLFNDYDQLNTINGAFSLFIHQKKDNHTLIATDRVGVQPIYFNTIQGKNNTVVFSPSLSVISQQSEIPLTIHPKGLFAHIGFGYHVAPHPFLYENMDKIPPATALYTNSNLLHTLLNYWEPISGTEDLTDQKMKNLAAAIKQHIHSVSDRNYLLGITAGKDSLVLASFFQHADHVHSGSYGQPGCSDKVQGEKLANQLNFNHTSFDLVSREELTEYAEHISFYSSGMATLSYVDMTKMCSTSTIKDSLFVMGEGGECVRDFFISKSDPNSSPLSKYITPLESISILNDSFKDQLNNYPEALLKDILPIKDEADLIRFYRSARMPGNFALRSSFLFPLTDKCVPFLDNQFIDLSYQLNPTFYKNSTLHRHILSEQNSSLLPYFDQPDQNNDNCQNWEERFTGATGQTILSLIEEHASSMEKYIDPEQIRLACSDQINNPGRGLYMILRILSLMLFMNKTAREEYYTSIQQSTIQHYL
jgi:asparagine synthetase B (glutamine-hydrolysing)